MRAAILLSLAATLVSAQESSLASTAVEPAATVVATPSDATVDLLQEETVQITEEVISELWDNENVADVADLFTFANTTVGSEFERRRLARRELKCKTAPGDVLWPSELTWNIFDLLLGGALEKVVPIASPCYPNSEFNNYNAAQCAKITTEWSLDTTQ
jgi:hypothetical protein